MANIVSEIQRKVGLLLKCL